MANTKVVAHELHARFEPLRAVTIMGRLLQKALFGGRADEVVFWALVFAQYNGGSLSPSGEEELAAFSEHIFPDPSADEE
jgi:hypothetical protein